VTESAYCVGRVTCRPDRVIVVPDCDDGVGVSLAALSVSDVDDGSGGVLVDMAASAISISSRTTMGGSDDCVSAHVWMYDDVHTRLPSTIVGAVRQNICHFRSLPLAAV
jgi:hypothetical protein